MRFLIKQIESQLGKKGKEGCNHDSSCRWWKNLIFVWRRLENTKSAGKRIHILFDQT